MQLDSANLELEGREPVHCNLLYLGQDVQEQHNRCKQQHCLEPKDVLLPFELLQSLAMNYECAEVPKLKRKIHKNN